MEERLWKINKLICGDNLEELAKLPKESIDLIYIDRHSLATGIMKYYGAMVLNCEYLKTVEKVGQNG